MVACVKTKKAVVFLMDDNHLRDITYVDYINVFMSNVQDTILIFDEKIVKELIEIEEEEYLKDEMNAKFGRTAADPTTRTINKDMLLQTARTKILKNLHLVFNLNHLETYHTYTSTFPHIETHFEVLYIDDMTNEGYVNLSQEYLMHRDIDEDLLRNNIMAKELVYFRN